MNRNGNSHNSAPVQDKSSKNFFASLMAFLTSKTTAVFGSATLYQEKLPIIYANIRV